MTAHSSVQFLDRAAMQPKNLSCLLAGEVPDSIPSLGTPILIGSAPLPPHMRLLLSLHEAHGRNAFRPRGSATPFRIHREP
jgi:hypothetical protein